MCAIIYQYVCPDSFICVPCHIHMCHIILGVELGGAIGLAARGSVSVSVSVSVP